jgi:hypothetical protein
LQNRKDFSGVFGGLWYTAYMTKNRYTSKEIGQLGAPVFAGVNVRIYRVTSSKGTLEFKCHRIPMSDLWNVNKKKLR